MRWVYRLTDGQFLRGGASLPRGPSAEEGVLTLDRMPDYRGERGGPAGLRRATADELTAFDRAQATAALTDDVRRTLRWTQAQVLTREPLVAEETALREAWITAQVADQVTREK